MKTPWWRAYTRMPDRSDVVFRNRVMRPLGAAPITLEAYRLWTAHNREWLNMLYGSW